MGMSAPKVWTLRLEWRASQATLLVKGSLAVPDSMPWTDARKTTEYLVCWTKLQTWQVGLSHSGAL